MGGEDFLAPMEPASQRMTNADFRKLMMTPRAGSGAVPATPSPGGITPGGGAMSGGSSAGAGATPRRVDKAKAEERRKKKTFYAKMKKEEDDKIAELAEKYRDRAKERREGVDGNNVPTEDATNAYRAVAPNAHGVHDAAERRKQMIHESKYLGGDMEHTHLVKGLDFALLQKVRAEIISREVVEAEEEEEEGSQEAGKKGEEKADKKDSEAKDDEEDELAECRTRMGKNLMRIVFNPDGPKSNELFMPGRMAYVMDLEEDGESDIPTTSIRSKKDVVNSNQKSTISTNDIVINKLTQILSYLRAGSRTKRKKKDKIEDLLAVEEDVIKNNVVKGKDAEIPIYDDIDDYKPSRKESKRRDRERSRERRDRSRERRRSRSRDRDYRRSKDDRRRSRSRERKSKKQEERERDRHEREERPSKKQSYFDKPSEEPQEKHSRGFSNEDKAMIKALMRKEEDKEKQTADKKLAGMMKASENDGYAECYPGLAEMDDAVIDSDDEADFSKMDMGNKKGPVGRWDFDTAEEYADYMGNKEAMPKAAFQYGMKMSDGRKTRGKVGTKKNEKAKLDREWNQILGVINKRKGGEGGGSAKKSKHNDDD